jgi:NAD-dependent deacetylase
MTGKDAPRLRLVDYRNIVILTGAGVSVASGIRPYRGPDGLWNDEALVRLSEIGTFNASPLDVWKHWWKLRELGLTAKPNAAHTVLVDVEASLTHGTRFTLITQNVDGLHTAAGSKSVVEYHGSGMRTRCSNPRCSLQPFRDLQCSGDTVPLCPRCGSPLRPDIVLFGEAIPQAAADTVEDALDSCELFIAVGTSGTVWPAAMFVNVAHGRGARTIYLNLQPLAALGGSGDFEEEYIGPAEELLPRMLGKTGRLPGGLPEASPAEYPGQQEMM